MTKLQDVVKGLKCGSCTTCPYFQTQNCTHVVKWDAIKLIESQQAEIERLTEMVERIKPHAFNVDVDALCKDLVQGTKGTEGR